MHCLFDCDDDLSSCDRLHVEEVFAFAYLSSDLDGGLSGTPNDAACLSCCILLSV